MDTTIIFDERMIDKHQVLVFDSDYRNQIVKLL